MVNPKSQYHRPIVIPKKVTLKLKALHHLIHLTERKISLHLLPPLSNAHIDFRSKNQHLQNLHAKACKHYLHHYLWESYFRPMISTPIYWSYDTSDGSDTSPLSAYLGEWTVKYSPKDPPFRNTVNFSWCKISDVNSLVHYCTEGYVQSPNKKILLLPPCQHIYVLYTVHTSM